VVGSVEEGNDHSEDIAKNVASYDAVQLSQFVISGFK
jgi:hypothetical protein